MEINSENARGDKKHDEASDTATSQLRHDEKNVLYKLLVIVITDTKKKCFSF